MKRPRLVLTIAAAALLAAAPVRADGDKNPPPNPPATTTDAPPKPPQKHTGHDGRIKMGDDPSNPAPEQPKEPEKAKTPEKSEAEVLFDALAGWPSQDAKQASVRLALEPAVAYPMLEKAMRDANP